MLEVDDVSARCQWSRRGGGNRAAITTRPPQPARAKKDLVIGEHAERRHNEAAVERADGERRPIRAEQLFQSLQLSLVIAEDHRRRRLGNDLPQSLQVPVDVLRRGEWKAL